MAVNFLYVSVACTALSLLGLQWWLISFLDRIKSDGILSGGALEVVLSSHVTIALLVNLALNVYFLIVIGLKTLFFVQLSPAETRKVLERFINYIIYKGTFLPLVVPPNGYQVAVWSTWLLVLCSFKMFLTLAKDRLERLNASPSATPAKYFRVFSALLFVVSADFLWIRLCMMIYQSFSSKLYLLLFFEPLCILCETLLSVMVHGFQFLEIWHRHYIESGGDCSGSQASYKLGAGSLSEWKGILIRHGGFLLDMMTVLMALGHYLIIWWLHGMAFQLVDAILFLNLRALVSTVVKLVKGYIKMWKALNSLNGALPDATYEELCAYDDECAICRGPMARAKKLQCNHLFHLGCLRSWLDQGLTDAYACPTCRRPLFLSRPQNHSDSPAREVANDDQIAVQGNLGFDPQRIQGHTQLGGAIANQQRNPDTVWRGAGLDSAGWVHPWPNAGIDGPSTSNAIRSVGLTGVQMMMRQLASVGENFSHGSLEDAGWSFWPSHQASGSSIPPSPAIRNNRNGSGLRFRNNSPSVNPNMSELRTMVDRVREVLPHIHDELIIQDLLRTNNINITVNNLLLVQ
ncbi:autocrine motility factor receptor protein [Dioscorea alata]|uniref:Autocrine motility factor receptor protein n=1 Tax=Dioscorea alata TaxID=55571 RepID=A0ACB7WIR5_DIOAL|nr:autocrine motility factor receptor protein [Dioscorea alata]